MPKLTWDKLLGFTEEEAREYLLHKDLPQAIELAYLQQGEDFTVWRVVANLRGIRMGEMEMGNNV